ncbi:hypothetical protein IEQ34_023091 [Dendrobium chrysotoxum]|uniref:Uncharacterized protein n=1 Tax=Dendrobium chrysotoxum TaxID=161865 RepID=A0AAV7FZA2_DENCH|nr:hypothetical protein IEQ34_023091 [Dendrobium chrysotoxum]
MARAMPAKRLEGGKAFTASLAYEDVNSSPAAGGSRRLCESLAVRFHAGSRILCYVKIWPLTALGKEHEAISHFFVLLSCALRELRGGRRRRHSRRRRSLRQWKLEPLPLGSLPFHHGRIFHYTFH